MGTPAFSVPSLETTARLTRLELVVTQPDRPAGRGQRLTLPPLKQRALELGIEVVQPERSVTAELAERLATIAPDVMVVAAFGKILGRKILSLPPHGCINVHASLLPRHRGASPIARAILAGDDTTGITIQRMAAEMDAGDVIAQRSTPIGPDETAGELTVRLSCLGAELLGEVLEALSRGPVDAHPQDHSAATLAPPLEKKEGEIDWGRPARAVHDHVRGMNPWPVAFTSCRDQRILVYRTRVVEGSPAGRPGEVVCADRKGLVVSCGAGAVELVEAQREGGKRLRGCDMAAGRTLTICDLLGGEAAACEEK